MTQTAIAPSMRLQRKDKAISVEMGSDTVMMDIDMDAYFALTGSGSFIWAMLEKPATLDEIMQNIHQEFDLSGHENVEEIVSQFVGELLARGLVCEAN